MISTEGRLIFQYMICDENGERKVFGDPLVLRDRLASVSLGEFWRLREKVRAIAAAKDDYTVVMEGLKAREHLIYIAREVFGLPPFDEKTGKGMLAEDCLAVTEEFLRFTNQKKTRQEPQPTISTPTESISPAPTSPTSATTSA